MKVTVDFKVKYTKISIKCSFLIRFQCVIPLFGLEFHEESNGYDGLASQRPLRNEGHSRFQGQIHKNINKMLISDPIWMCDTTILHEISQGLQCL